MKKFECKVCHYVAENEAPAVCPVCKQAGKFEASIPVALGKKASCKATCMFQQENYDAEVKPDDADVKKVMLTYKGEAKLQMVYGETVYVDLIGKRVGATNDPYHFNP